MSEYIIKREFNAPIELIFDTFTQSDHLVKWWKMRHLKMRKCRVDLKIDGIFHYCMLTYDKKKVWGKFLYKEITKPNKLVFLVSFSNKDENVTRHPFVDEWPLEIINTLVLEELEDKTTLLTLSCEPYKATAEEIKKFEERRSNFDEDSKLMLDCLQSYINTLDLGKK